MTASVAGALLIALTTATITNALHGGSGISAVEDAVDDVLGKGMSNKRIRGIGNDDLRRLAKGQRKIGVALEKILAELKEHREYILYLDRVGSEVTAKYLKVSSILTEFGASSGRFGRRKVN
jgi:phosphoglycerate-specific signal transduction histidine kinase